MLTDPDAKKAGTAPAKAGDYILDSANKPKYKVDTANKKVQSLDGAKTYYIVDSLS